MSDTEVNDELTEEVRRKLQQRDEMFREWHSGGKGWKMWKHVVRHLPSTSGCVQSSGPDTTSCGCSTRRVCQQSVCANFEGCSICWA